MRVVITKDSKSSKESDILYNGENLIASIDLEGNDQIVAKGYNAYIEGEKKNDK